MSRRWTVAAVFAVALAGFATNASAGVITATDIDNLTYGSYTGLNSADDFLKSSGVDNGDLDNWVYSYRTSSGQVVYTYFHLVTAEVDDVSEFATDFDVRGFNGVAGWNFDNTGFVGDAKGAGGAGTSADFVITHDSDGSLDWQVATTAPDGTSWFDDGDEVLFFFQSTYVPSTGLYTLTNGGVAEAVSYAPVPLPPAALMGLGLLGGLGLIGRLRKRRSA